MLDIKECYIKVYVSGQQVKYAKKGSEVLEIGYGEGGTLLIK
jgi:hypothetical protein